MWSRTYAILDFRADPHDIERQVREGYHPAVGLVLDKPIGQEVRVAVTDIDIRGDHWTFGGFLCEHVTDYSVGVEFYRETDVSGQIFCWKGRTTMNGHMTIGKERGKSYEPQM